VARFLFIVARHLPRVYDHLCEQFASEPTVDVIMDRRKGDRREPEIVVPPPGPERREGERRRNSDADEQLRVMGYAFVRLAD
jgi:hypothetical protein